MAAEKIPANPNGMSLQDALATWRDSLTEWHTLPSGLTVLLKHVGLKDLAAAGMVPETLSNVLQTAMEGGSTKVRLNDLEAVGEAYNLVAMQCIQWPPVAEEADEEHLAISELPYDDREWIFNWANGEAQEMANFPEKE